MFNTNDENVFKNNKLFYREQLTSDLYMFDGSNPIKLAAGVTEFKINEAADKVVYISIENNLYQIRIVYYQKISATSEYTNMLYQAELKNISATEKLINTNLDYIDLISAENGNIYFTVNQQKLYCNDELILSDISSIYYNYYKDSIALFIYKSSLLSLATVHGNEYNLIYENVKYPYITSKNHFFFLVSNTGQNNGTLKYYDAASTIDIDTDVSSIDTVIEFTK